MSEWSWEATAMHGGEMPDGLPQEEQLAFLEMRSLHEQYRRGYINLDKAKKDKAKILVEFRKRKEAREFSDRQCSRWTTILRNADNGASEYRLTRSMEAADKMLKAIEGVT